MSSLDSSSRLKAIKSLCLLSLLVLLGYSNSFNAAWHLDDLPNIVNNPRLHLEHFSFTSLKQTFKASPAHPGEGVYRPLPCLSFALNWLAGGDNPFGYHVVNLFVHLITAFFLFMTMRLILATPAVKAKNLELDSLSISLLAALLWAINPVQIQAVTYIVQRMAAMAAMFTTIGLYGYLRARFALGKERWLWSIITMMAFCCALLSKENAILFPFSLALIEGVCFGTRAYVDRLKAIISIKTLLIAITFMAVLVGIVVHVFGNPVDVNHYAGRPFSLWQRLITQPRVVTFYLSLLLYPAPWRLSIEHDIHASLSLFEPWTTLPAIIFVIALASFGLMTVKKSPLIALAILFFLLNHAVESTILPLELIFEHRNYLPSLFFFLPVSFCANWLLNRGRQEFRSLYPAMVVCMTAIIMATGYACYLRNGVWQNEYSLWFDALKKAPENARPLMYLGAAIGWESHRIANRDDIALALFRKALTLSSSQIRLPAKIYGNIGLIHTRKGELQQAIAAYHKALEIEPNERKIRFDLIRGLIATGNWHAAETHLKTLLSDKFGTPSELSYVGFVALWDGKPERAIQTLQQVLQSGYRDAFVYHTIGVTMATLGFPERGSWFLERALELANAKSRGKAAIYFSLMESHSKALDPMGAVGITYRLLAEFSLDEILAILSNLPGNHTYPPIDTESVARILSLSLSDIMRSVDGR